ncbi:MAG TPA: hypothetical protein VHL78_01250 [Actinomycetota bacterium]|nr:hypothetical protein [Actinomycetota bacterium]
MREPGTEEGRLPARDVARFTAIVAVLAIFSDAALGHGLTWENDPYWTYWITKTFLIATIFGLGTAWFGLGLGRGAAITAVHTLVLTVYYWSLSPVGLPSSPEWLDFEHTWVTGVPIHFGVIYIGYLLALWLWRRRAARPIDEDESSAAVGTAALALGVAIVVVTGGLSSLALGSFPGVTWFLVRLLLTIPFLMWWWAWAGRDLTSAVVGGVTLAFAWATYSHFLGPVGLPDLPVRVFTTDPPPATVEWLDYRQLWVISLPIYVVTMVGILALAAVRLGRRPVARPAAAALAGMVAVLLLTGATDATLGQDGEDATLRATGPAEVETGPWYSDSFAQARATLRIQAEDMGARVTPLPPHDTLNLLAQVQVRGRSFTVLARRAIVAHPAGAFTTWWGVGLDVEHHGDSGIGTSELPTIRSELAAFGLATVQRNGRTIATGVPVHVMTAESGLPGGARLELDVGPEGGRVPGLPNGHLRVLWQGYTAEIEDDVGTLYISGGLVILAILLALLFLVRRQPREPVA